MTSNPLVSVVMPVKNVEKYIDESLQSIINQTYKNIEIVIIDDHSQDETYNIIKNYQKIDKRIKIFRNSSTKYISHSLNTGIKHSKGKYIIRMDGDDYSYPNRIATQVKFMEKNPKIGVSGGSIDVCNEKLNILFTKCYPLNDHDIRKKIFYMSPFAHPATIWRSNMLKQTKGYNIHLFGAEDYDLYFRIGKMCNMANIDNILIKYRLSNHSFSYRKHIRQESLTLYIRMKAYVEYGYFMSLKERIYSLLQFMSMGFIPPKIRFYVFENLRKFLIK